MIIVSVQIVVVLLAAAVVVVVVVIVVVVAAVIVAAKAAIASVIASVAVVAALAEPEECVGAEFGCGFGPVGSARSSEHSLVWVVEVNVERPDAVAFGGRVRRARS